MRRASVLAAVAVAAAALAPVTAAGKKAQNPSRLLDVKFEQVQRDFKSPSMLYAPFIFWFWDEPLNPQKMAEMSRVMMSQGFNPGYAHARRSMVGTPSLPDDNWLTDRWFESFGAALGEAEKAGGYLGFCDEYWWPSFQVNNRLVREHPELRAETLNWQVTDVLGGTEVPISDSYFVVAAQLAKEPVIVQDKLPQFGKWIWAPGAAGNKHSCWLRKTFDIPAGAKITSATVRATVDNGYALYLNGKKIGGDDNWYEPEVYNITADLRSGRNVLAMQADNVDGAYGAILGGSIALDSGTVIPVRSDASWKSALQQPAENWTSLEFDDTSWAAAQEICGVDEGAWAFKGLGGGGTSYKHSDIRSSTLRVIGSGKAFNWKAPTGAGWRVYTFTRAYHAGAFDGEQANVIDERTTKTFAKMALEPYADRLGDKLGKSIPGDFIDHEGDYGWKLAWSDTLDRTYKERYGRDIRRWMPLMLDQDVEGVYAKARWEWFDVISDLYSASFQATTDWNEKRGGYTTAHVWEESIPAQVSAVGDHMKLLRALSMPGQDCLGIKPVIVHDFKEISSVAEFGDRRAATELMGAGGWGVFTPEFLKQSVNAVTAWGMGHIIPHGVFTTRKLTGNPWMPDWYSDNPFFPWLHLWNDFARRASYINSTGHACPDVLLYNPIESAWILSSTDMLDESGWTFAETSAEARKIHAIDRSYDKAMKDLTEARVEFLVGDRKYVSEMTVKDGKLVRGPLQFRTVVLPPLEILQMPVARKIVDFARAGGRVYSLGSLPSGSVERGMNDPEMIVLMRELSSLPAFTQCTPEPKDCRSHWSYERTWVFDTDASTHGLKPLIEKHAAGLTSPVQFLSREFPMLQEHRRVDGRDFYWLANNSEKDAQACQLQIAGAHGAASVWDCETGTVRPVPSKDGRDGSAIGLAFKPLEAYWLVFDPKKRATSAVSGETVSEILTVDGPWGVKIDPAAQPVMEKPVKPDDALVTGVQKPLEDWSAWLPKEFSGVIDYTTSVSIPEVRGRLRLDLGTVHSAAEVWVNGKQCGMRLWGPYEFDITGAAKAGTNEVRVRVANLINNSYGDTRESGLRGPVRVLSVK